MAAAHPLVCSAWAHGFRFRGGALRTRRHPRRHGAPARRRARRAARHHARRGGNAVTRKQRRLTMIASAGAVLVVAAALVLFALRDQIVFFYSPTELAEKALAPGTRVRLGGLVEAGSVVRGEDGTVSFSVTDTAKTTRVDF